MTELRRLAIVDTAPEPHFDAVCRLACDLFSVPIATITFVEADRQWFKATCGLDTGGGPRDEAFCAHTILSDDPLIVADAVDDPRFAANAHVLGAPGIRFYAGVPLALRSGLRLGTLCLIDTAPRCFSSSQIRQLQDLAEIVLAHLRLHEAAQAQAIELIERRRMTDELSAANGVLIEREQALHASELQLRDLNTTLAQRVVERTQEAEAARALAEAGNRAKSEFLASMSHEIRTPLNGVIGYADLLSDAPGLPAPARRYAENIRSAGAALLTVVDDVLHFSKIEAGQVEIVPRPFVPAKLIDGALAIVRGAAEARGLAVGATLAPDLPSCLLGDEDRLAQVLLNLLGNAVKFTQAGSVTLAVAVERTVGAMAHLRFAVSDTGIGIPANRRDRLFRRFSQVDGSISRTYGGTGLGLAICKGLIERMGGVIDCESAEGAGSTFWFAIALPIVATAQTSSASPAKSIARKPQRRLLLAEDVPLNQELARAVLQQAGHTVDVVADGAAAVEAVRARTYDLVLMDLQMPVLDGLSAIRQIRALAGPIAQVPIVAMTAHVLPEQVAEAMASGADGYVSKPFRREALLDAIDRLTRASTADVSSTSLRADVPAVWRSR